MKKYPLSDCDGQCEVIKHTENVLDHRDNLDCHLNDKTFMNGKKITDS